VSEFKKLGNDRLQQSLAQAVNFSTGNPKTEQIAHGTVVAVEFKASATGSAEIGSRRTGAIPINQPFDTDSWKWVLAGTKLNVTYGEVQTGTSYFWVF
jgi:hypothetical protein